ncbi:MAG: hypothetical protein ACM30G_08795 [Micromonosporaceae bacterium]
MTSPTIGGSPRVLAVWAMLGYAGLTPVFAFLDWIFPSSPATFASRSYGDFDNFVNVFTMVLPVLAVLLAVYVEPGLPGARLMATVALVEYAVVLLFGVVTLLVGLGVAFSDYPGNALYSFGRALDGLGYLVLGVGELILVAIAMLVVYRAYTALGGRLTTWRP